MDELLEEKKEQDLVLEAHSYFDKYSKKAGLGSMSPDEYQDRRDAFSQNYVFVNLVGKRRKVKVELN